MILWGLPGTGKTTIAHIIANTLGKFLFPTQCTSSGVKEVRGVIEEAKEQNKLHPFH